MQYKKAISPLIATVLLISFAIAVASIIFSWGTGFTNTLLNPTSDKGQKQVQCTFANIDVKKADIAYNFSGSTSTVNVTAYNSGSEGLYNFSFIVITNGGVYTFNPTNQYNETAPMAKGTAVLFKTVNSTGGAPAGTETFSKLKVTALCRKDYRITNEVDMT